MDRFHFNAIITQQDIFDTYLPAWEAAVKDGGVQQIMCSYNEVNGIPACGHHFFLNEVLRKRWGFQGFVVSDDHALQGIYAAHKYTKNASAGAALALTAGVDSDDYSTNWGPQPSFWTRLLPVALQEKLITEMDVDVALTRIFRMRMRQGEFDDWALQPYRKIGPEVIDSKKHRELTRLVAQESMTLLKNAETSPGVSMLPLKAMKGMNVAVIGPFGNATIQMQGDYYGPAPYIVTIVEGLQKYVGTETVKFAQGCKICFYFCSF